MKKYIVNITEVDTETGESKEFSFGEGNDNEFTGLTLLADRDQEKACVTVLHDNVMNIAAKISCEEKLMLAARLAVMMKDHSSPKMEDMLLNSLMGGIQ